MTDRLTLDERMTAWAISTLAEWGAEPSPANVDKLLKTQFAGRTRLDMAMGDLGADLRQGLRDARHEVWSVARRIRRYLQSKG